MSFNLEEKAKILNDFFANESNNIEKQLKKGGSIDLLEKIKNNEEKKNTFILNYRQIPLGIESFFVVLRKWNSYTPSLPNINGDNSISQHSIGGGYFLFIQGEVNSLDPGYGMVIDPGYNFIHNFGLAGFCLDDIDGILLTHAHNDHTNDFESLLSLLYQRNKKFIGKRNEKKVDLFFNLGSFKKFSNYLDLANKDKKNYIGKVTVMSPGQVYELNERNLDFKILTLQTKHHEIITADYSLGICFKISNRNIYLTSDTGWDFSISSQNEDFLYRNGVNTKESKESDNVDLLIAHLGSIKKEEFNIQHNDLDFENKYYENHLGLLGVISLIELWKPEFCIISEFGEELSKMREVISRCIEKSSKRFHKSFKCVPGDLGLFVFLDSKKCLSYSKNDLIKWEKIIYKDVYNINTNQWDIYYYSNELLKANRNEQFLIENINIIKGLNIISIYWKKQLMKEYNVRDNENLKLLLLKKIHEAKTSVSDISLMENNEIITIGDLLILNYFIKDNPLEVLNINHPSNLELLLDYFLTFNIYTEIFKKFVIHLASEGFDLIDEDKEDNEIDKHKSDEYLKLIKLFLVKMTNQLQDNHNDSKVIWINECEDVFNKIKAFKLEDN